MLSVLPSEISMLAGRISSHALHKLLPPMQCFGLYALAKHETLNYQPLGLDKAYNLYENLNHCNINFGKPFDGKNESSHPLYKNIKNLGDILLIQGYYPYPQESGFRLVSVKSNTEKKKEIQEFKLNIKKKECTILIIHLKNSPDKLTILGLNDEGDFRSELIDEPRSKLSLELKKTPLNKSKIVKIVTSILGRTYAKNRKNKYLVCKPSIKEKGNGKRKLFFENDICNAVYSGLSLLNTTPRFAADLWSAFEKIRKLVESQHDDTARIKDQESGQVENIIAQLCRNQLLRDGALTPTARRLTRGGFFNDVVDEWDLEALPLITRAVIDDGMSISANNDGNNNWNEKCLFFAHKAIEWRFRLKNKYKQNEPFNQIEYKQPGKHYLSVDHLSADTTGAMILFHDLLSLGPNHRFNSFLLSADINSIKDSWCKTIWSDGLALEAKLPWYPPLCHSFFGFDLFLSAWNRLLNESTEILSAVALAFIWMSAGTAVIASQSKMTFYEGRENDIVSIRLGENFPNDKDWDYLGGKLVEMIANIPSDHLIQVQQTQSWLISIAVMIMPETGLSGNISSLYSEKTEILQHWSEFPRSIRKHRNKRLKTIYKSGMRKLSYKLYETEASGLELEVDTPRGKEPLWRYLQPHGFVKEFSRRNLNRREDRVSTPLVGQNDRRIQEKDRRAGASLH